MSLATIDAGGPGESQYNTLTQQAVAGTGDVTAVHAQRGRNHMKRLASIGAAAIKGQVNIGSEPTPVAPVPLWPRCAGSRIR